VKTLRIHLETGFEHPIEYRGGAFPVPVAGEIFGKQQLSASVINELGACNSYRRAPRFRGGKSPPRQARRPRSAKLRP
jgi:hypothetical protein